MQGLVGHNDDFMAYQDVIFLFWKDLLMILGKNKLERGKNRGKETVGAMAIIPGETWLMRAVFWS